MTSASTTTPPRKLAATLRITAIPFFVSFATARSCTKSDLLPDPTYEPGGAWTIRDCTSVDLSCDFVPGARATPCGNALASGELGAVTEMLKDAPNLRSLELRGNWLGPLGVAGLAARLKGHGALEALGLASTRPGDAGVRVLAKALLADDPPPSLRALALRHNNVGDDGARALSDGLRSQGAPPLRALDLGWNAIGTRGGRYLGDAVAANVSLAELHLPWNGLADRGARALGDALPTNGALASLDLGHNAIGDAGGRALARGARSNGALRRLVVDDNGLSAGVADDVAAAVAAAAPVDGGGGGGEAPASRPAARQPRYEAADDEEIEEISMDEED